MSDAGATPGEVTQLLAEIREGVDGAESRLIPLVYDELRKLAGRFMRQEDPGHTLQTTALVHEAYIRLMGGASCPWQDRAHFFAVAAQTMRRVLVDYARARKSEKRGGGSVHVDLDQAMVSQEENWDDILLVEEALSRLAKIDERQAHLVELRFFAGLSVKETAEILNVSPRTVTRDWEFVQAWLYAEISRSRGPGGTPSGEPGKPLIPPVLKNPPKP